MVNVQCQACRAVSEPQNPSATGWDCGPCGAAYLLRRCSACGVPSDVNSAQGQGVPWNCQWCGAPNSGFSRRKDPAEATLSDLATSMARNGLTYFATLRREPLDTEPMLIVTTNEIPGFRITQVHGDVFGLTVRSRSYFSNLGAQITSVVGGEVPGYTKLLTDSRNQARERMWREARARGANAVVAMRFDCNELSGVMSEIAAYGTAVTVEPGEGLHD
ncbi:MAG TPA: YbjQ family protein [Trebonia sp.]|jgi:uncharacterized protein YbjQ (UPF0145 family)